MLNINITAAVDTIDKCMAKTELYSKLAVLKSCELKICSDNFINYSSLAAYYKFKKYII